MNLDLGSFLLGAMIGGFMCSVAAIVVAAAIMHKEPNMVDPVTAELLALSDGRSQVIRQPFTADGATLFVLTTTGWALTFGLDDGVLVDVDGAIHPDGRLFGWDDWDDNGASNPGVWLKQHRPEAWKRLGQLVNGVEVTK